MKRLLPLLLLLAVVILPSCTAEPSDGLAEYKYDFGITLRLPEGYSRAAMEGFDLCLVKGNVYFFAVKESFEKLESERGFSSDSGLVDYADLITKQNGIDSQIIVSGRENVRFNYATRSNDGVKYYFYATVHKGKDAFWLCQFSCPADEYSSLEEDFDTWSTKIKVD